jgi:hypothetical protein
MTSGNRYMRVAGVESIGRDGVARLRAARVAVVGTGNIGGVLLPHLAMLGIATILIDRDVVIEENLGTQMFPEDYVGLPKVQARALTMHELNSAWKVETIHADVTRLGLGTFAEVDLVFCCLDSRSARAAVSEMAMRAGKPLVDAALDGSGRSFFGRVAAYDTACGTACYLCPLGLRALRPDGGARGCPHFDWNNEESAPATVAVSALGAAAAAQQFVWGLQFLLGRGADVSGKEMYFDMGAVVVSVQRLQPDPNCVLDHRALPFTPLSRGPAEITIGETFREAERVLGTAAALEFHRSSLVTELRCPACLAARRPFRLLSAITAAEGACACGGSLVPSAAGLMARFTEDQAVEFTERTWAEVGVPSRDVISASAGGVEVHLLLG